MSGLIEAMRQLESAEEFFNFFGVEFDPAVVNVSRLHILQRFHQYLRQESGFARHDEAGQRQICTGLLERAYGDFVHSSPLREKVFKVFRDAEGVKTVSVENLRAALH
jgi:nitrogenase-stabilizing/protective protein